MRLCFGKCYLIQVRNCSIDIYAGDDNKMNCRNPNVTWLPRDHRDIGTMVNGITQIWQNLPPPSPCHTNLNL